MDKVQILRPEHFQSASRLLADSFFDNPAHMYICSRPNRRHNELRWLLGGSLKLQPDLSRSFCLFKGDTVEAMGFWTKSNGPKAAMWKKVQALIFEAPFHLGLGGMLRLAEVTSEIDKGLMEVLENGDYWYLNNMVVAEYLRGSGIGTQILRDQLIHFEKTNPITRFALTTQRPENVVFYERLGFKSVSETTIGSGPRKFISWIMVRSDDA